MKAQLERLEFSKRLQQALHNADYSPNSPTRLAREFNLRFAGQPVSVHAARKWLQGESFPTQEKLRALAEWLDVPTDWLRFGNVDNNRNVRVSTLPTGHGERTVLRLLDKEGGRLDLQ